MKRLRILLILFCASALMTGQALAFSLSLLPSAQHVERGAVAVVTLNVSGLSDGEPTYVGAFDVSLQFDPAVLSIQTTEFGPFLGDEGLGQAITHVETSLPGTVRLNEVSLLEERSEDCVFCRWPFLDSLQEDAFPLATLTFRTSTIGVSPLELTDVTLSHASGDVLPISTILGAEVAVVPLPSTAPLLLTGLIGLAGARWRSARRKKASP